MADEGMIYGFDAQSMRRVIREILHSERSPRVELGTGGHGNGGGNQQVWFPFRNEYAGEMPAHSVVRIDDTLKLSTLVSGCDDDGLVYLANRPSTTFTRKYGVTWGVATPQGDYGLLTFGPHGVIAAYDTSGSPAAGEGWGAKPDSFLLFKNYPTTAYVDAIYDSTNKYMKADWGLINSVFAQTQGSIAKNATTGIVEPFYGLPGSGATIIDASMTIGSVCNPWETVADNKKVRIGWDNGVATLTGKEC